MIIDPTIVKEIRQKLCDQQGLDLLFNKVAGNRQSSKPLQRGKQYPDDKNAGLQGQVFISFLVRP